MKTIGIVEFNSIPKGIENLDRVIKETNINVFKAGVTCPGKYYFIVYGDNQDIIEASKVLEDALKFEIISGVSKKMIEILERKNTKVLGNSIGVMEFFTISESVKALDMILKNNPVQALKLILGAGLAGKSYFVITGDTESIKTSLDKMDIKCKSKAIINNPSKDILKHI